jgi:hypothetical protein
VRESKKISIPYTLTQINLQISVITRKHHLKCADHGQNTLKQEWVMIIYLGDEWVYSEVAAGWIALR